MRRHQGIKIRSKKGNSFSDANLFTVNVAGLVDVKVLRGWQSIVVKVRKSPWFRFSNLHLEAFDDRKEVPSIRARQAQEFVDKTSGGSCRTSRSATSTRQSRFGSRRRTGLPGHASQRIRECRHPQSHELLHQGFLRSAHRIGEGLRPSGRSDLHQHTTPSDEAQLWVTGRKKQNGWWNSDHAGVVSRLLVMRRG